MVLTRGVLAAALAGFATSVSAALIVGGQQFNSGNVLPSPIVAVSGDLLETSVSSATGEASNENVRNGTTGTAGENSTQNPAAYGMTVVTYNLNTTASPLGYDLQEIRLFSGWTDGRAGQSYSLSYSVVGSPSTFNVLGTVSALQNNGSLLTRTYDSTGANILTGVAALRFTMIDNGLAGTGTVFREIDVLGSPSLLATANATNSTVAASPATVANDGISSSTITVTLLNASSQAVAGKTVTLASSRGTNDTISAAAGASGTDGVVTFTVKSTTAGTAIFTATDTTDGVVVAQTATVSFAAGVPSPANSTVTASPTTVPADGATTSTITVTLLTGNSTPVSGRTVTLASSRGAVDAISAASGPSTTNGVVTFTVTSAAAGVAMFTATDTTDGMVVTQTATVAFTVGAVSAGGSTVTAFPTSVLANGTAASTISVTLKDAHNNPVSGKAVTLASSRGTYDMISAASGPSSINGLVTFSVTSWTNGSSAFTATDATDGNLVLTQTASVAFTTYSSNRLEYYVATTGNDTNAGTRAAPFRTLAAAQLAVRAVLPLATQGVTVWVRGGTYYLGQTLVFGPQDSGTSNAPVIYAGYTNETVVLSGAVKLTPAWSVYGGNPNIQVANVGAGLEFDGLFVNGAQQVLARYPNYDSNVTILNGYAADCISSNRAARWAHPETGLVRGLHDSMWGGNSFKITGLDANGNPTLQWVGDNNRGSGLHATYRMVENLFEELDTTNEWFYDKAAGNLYLWPPAGVNLATATVEAASLEELIRVVGTATNSPARCLTFSNFTFTQTHRTLFTRPYEGLMRGDWAVARAGAIYLANAENIVVANSTFASLGGNGVFISGYNRNHLVTGNEFLDTGASCVQVVGLMSATRYPSTWANQHSDIQDTNAGPLTADYPANITISYNHMYNLGVFEKEPAGVNISVADSITVSHNTIHRSPRAGINVNDGCFGGHVIEFNDVWDCVRETGDHGPFNSWGRDRYWSISGGDSTKRTYAFLDCWKRITLRNNRFYNAGWGMDLDDGSGNYDLCNNVGLNAGFKLREGFDRHVYNNIFVNGAGSFHVWYDTCRDQVYHNIIVSSSPYNYAGLDASNMGAKEAMIDTNFFWNGGAFVTVGFAGWSSLGFDLHSMTIDPMFKNIAANDYTVQNSNLLAAGFVNIPMDQFGKPGAPTPPSVTITSNSPPASDAEPLMGASASSVYSAGIQSATGIGDTNGLYFETVPGGSYAASQGFMVNDLVRDIEGDTVTTKQSFWAIYNTLPGGMPVHLVLRRNQTDQPFTFAKPFGPEVLNQTAGVVFTGTGWTYQKNASCFNGDLQSTANNGDYFEFTFFGTGVAFSSEKSSSQGQVAVYIDGVLDQTVSCYNASPLYLQTVYTRTGLSQGTHTLRGVKVDSTYLILDAVTIYSGSLLANSPGSSISTTSAVLNATLACTGAVYSVFACWNTANGGTNPAAWASSAYVGTWTNVPSTNLSYTATGLAPSALYYFTFHATSLAGDLWATNVQSFRTLSQPGAAPVVDNAGGVVNLAAGVAQLNGNLYSADPADVRLYWGATDGGTNRPWANTNMLAGAANGPFSSTVSNLLYGLTYYYRCAASNQYGMTWAPATASFVANIKPGQAQLPVSSGLALWMDASQLTGLANGQQVNTWTDVSGQANHALRGTGSSAGYPMYVTSQINGLPVVRFNSASANTGDYFKFNRISAIRTVFWVLKENGLLSDAHFLLGDDSTYHFHRGGANGPIWDAGYASANVLGGTTRLMGTTVNGTVTSIPANQFQLISLVTSGSVQADQITQDRVYHGSWQGDIAEILIYTNALSTNDEALVGGYLSAKYGLSTAYRAYRSSSIALTNSPATGVTNAAAVLHATLACTGAVYSVIACWNTFDAGTNAALWANSAYVGSWTNVASTNLSFTATGLSPSTLHYFTFCATNAADVLWATNVQSFTTPASPLPPVPVLPVSGVKVTNGVASFSFTATAGCKYRLDYKNALTDADWSYGPWSTNIAGSNQPMTLTDPGATGQPHRFYRLEGANP